jgi:hypothetical protein
MTLFPIITGLAGIISLFFPFIKDLSKWRNYFYNFSFFTLGITTGIIASMSEKAITSFTGEQLIQVLLVIAVLSLAIYLGQLFIKRKEYGFGYIVPLLLIDITLPRLIDVFKSKKELVEKQDLLMLSKHYEQQGHYQKAADYIRSYKDLVVGDLTDKQEKNLQNKIEYLDSMELNSISR